MTICATIEKWTFAQVDNDCQMRSVRKTLVAQVVIAHMVITRSQDLTQSHKQRNLL
jgi:hypothetical protein